MGFFVQKLLLKSNKRIFCFKSTFEKTVLKLGGGGGGERFFFNVKKAN